MRFMILVKANADSEAGVMPSSDELAEMGRYNEQLIDAGILLAADGLQSSAKGARIRRQDGKVVVIDGPFAETRELVAGYWLIQVASRDEALEWARRIPLHLTGEVELRQVFEAGDFDADTVSAEHLEKEQAWRDANERPITR